MIGYLGLHFNPLPNGFYYPENVKCEVEHGTTYGPTPSQESNTSIPKTRLARHCGQNLKHRPDFTKKKKDFETDWHNRKTLKACYNLDGHSALNYKLHTTYTNVMNS